VKSSSAPTIPCRSTDVHLGKNAGKPILAAMKNARESIRVMSPYLGAALVDALLEKAGEGLDVRLLTSTEFEERGEASARRLIIQKRHARHAARAMRALGSLACLAVFTAALAAAGLGYLRGPEQLRMAWMAAPPALLVFLLLRSMRVYSYSYEPRIPMASIVSPNTDGKGKGRFLIHAKMYVIDEEIAFLGSANFTKAGFGANYESRITVRDPEAVFRLADEFDRMFANKDAEYRDISEIGRALFPEPAN